MSRDSLCARNSDSDDPHPSAVSHSTATSGCDACNSRDATGTGSPGTGMPSMPSPSSSGSLHWRDETYLGLVTEWFETHVEPVILRLRAATVIPMAKQGPQRHLLPQPSSPPKGSGTKWIPTIDKYFDTDQGIIDNDPGMLGQRMAMTENNVVLLSRTASAASIV